jgi:hypothetical protein
VKNVLSVLAAVAVGLLMVFGITRVLERQQTADDINRLRDELYRARISADRCRGSLQTSEAALRSLSSTIDSLKTLVDDYEAMDRRGVPAGQYDEYLGVFDQYNDSVAVWEGREQRLRTAEASCRSTIQGHNALSDSLQRVLIEAGIETS